MEKTPPLIVAIERTRNGNQDEMRGRFSRVAIGRLVRKGQREGVIWPHTRNRSIRDLLHTVRRRSHKNRQVRDCQAPERGYFLVRKSVRTSSPREFSPFNEQTERRELGDVHCSYKEEGRLTQ